MEENVTIYLVMLGLFIALYFINFFANKVVLKKAGASYTEKTKISKILNFKLMRTTVLDKLSDPPKKKFLCRKNFGINYPTPFKKNFLVQKFSLNYKQIYT